METKKNSTINKKFDDSIINALGMNSKEKKFFKENRDNIMAEAFQNAMEATKSMMNDVIKSQNLTKPNLSTLFNIEEMKKTMDFIAENNIIDILQDNILKNNEIVVTETGLVGLLSKIKGMRHFTSSSKKIKDFVKVGLFVPKHNPKTTKEESETYKTLSKLPSIDGIDNLYFRYFGKSDTRIACEFVYSPRMHEILKLVISMIDYYKSDYMKKGKDKFISISNKLYYNILVRLSSLELLRVMYYSFKKNTDLEITSKDEKKYSNNIKLKLKYYSVFLKELQKKKNPIALIVYVGIIDEIVKLISEYEDNVLK